MLPRRKPEDWIELPEDSTVISVAEEILCAKWDGRLTLPDEANSSLIAAAALMILDCARGELNNNNRVPFIIPGECEAVTGEKLGTIISELIRTADEVDELCPKGSSEEDRLSMIVPKLKDHGYIVTREEEGE